MASQQDPQARPAATMESKIAPKRPLESSPSGGGDANKPAMKLQKLDLPPASAPPPKQDPISRGITPANLSAPMADVRAGGVPQRQPEAAGNAGLLHPTAEKPKAPLGIGKDAPVGVSNEGKKSPAVGEQLKPLVESKKADAAEVKGAPPPIEPVKLLKPVEEPAKASKPEAAEVPKNGDESKGGAKEGAEGGKEDAGRKEGAAEEGGEKESLGLAGRRILRPRQASAPPQGQRSRLRHRDGEAGSPGLDHSLLYKEGTGVPELGATYDSSPEGDVEGKNLVEVRIPPEAITLANKQVRVRQLWGTDVYTDDSDLVAVLMHTGYYTPSNAPPPPSVAELRVVVRLLPAQEGYPSSARNNMRSRAWAAAKGGCSFRVEKCWVVKAGGGTLDPEPSLSRNLAAAPTLVPAAMERTVTTRSSAQAASNRQRYLQEVTVQYNLCNEPWLKYSLSAVADRGLKPSQFTSSRLKKGDVLYVETQTSRFEISYVDQAATANGNVATSAPLALPTSASSSRPSSSHGLIHTLHAPRASLERPGTPQHEQPTYDGEKYRFARCKRALPLGVMRKKGIPLPAEELEVLEDGILWESIEWSPSAVWVRGKEHPLTRLQFMSRIVPVGS
ncbi:hypothetical protein KFL_000910150 [Klebsormidium nitens]|uniref:Uncharacterized protein n=1 Tax=Klebsormidium nitens TaxID=105231 RepID=A0A1Y1HT43_KLENI|nr:hypothetical protein KFL_000910150 [Klebsormidium nitens]|eukprot:GAQ81795.1 hypothetical protein KFL_000910150 [Klebsormidium nitens]